MLCPACACHAHRRLSTRKEMSAVPHHAVDARAFVGTAVYSPNYAEECRVVNMAARVARKVERDKPCPYCTPQLIVVLVLVGRAGELVVEVLTFCSHATCLHRPERVCGMPRATSKRRGRCRTHENGKHSVHVFKYRQHRQTTSRDDPERRQGRILDPPQSEPLA